MVELRNVYKSYDGKTNVIEDLNMTIQKGELIVLVGESGCGKTTTMQMLNRLIEPTKGEIIINGENTKNVNKNELRRNIGYVIQHVGLFPHKTIEENISTVPLLCKKNKTDIHNKTVELMEMVGLPYEQYSKRYPKELSGGQQQRVGVARALANEPDIILMDEPFSALDPITRGQLQDELLRLHDELDKTIVFVTHDIDEAIKLGDRIAVMQDGKIIQFDTPDDILKNPKNEFVEEFVGKDRLWKTPDMLKAEDIMNKNVVEINPNRTIMQAIEMMKKGNTTVVAVVDKVDGKKNTLLGIVGSNRFSGLTDHSVKMKDIMKKDVIKIPKEMALSEVISIRDEHDIKFSPVVDENDNLIGMITNTSILNVLSQIIPKSEEY